MSKLSLHRSTGFSLVEIMVGLAIGMLAVIVMLQVFALSEGRKRTTTSGGDAQSNGAVMLYQLQRDISQAGYGIGAVNLFNCNVTWPVASGSSIATAIPLAPVTINPSTAIIPAGDPNTDRLLVVYGNTNGEPQGNAITAQAAAVYTVQMPSAFKAGANGVGDKVIAAPDTCGNLIIDRITAVAANAVTVATGVSGVTLTTLYNLGPTPTILAYAIRGGNLTVCNYIVNDCGLAANKGDPSIWVPMASNIVGMRAQYARDTSGDAIPDVYDQTTPTTDCGWARASAVRLALVARSSQFEKGLVTNSAPTWAGSTADNPVGSGSESNPIDLTKNPDGTTNPDWQRYRYKVFQTVVPIRNVAWMGVPTGC